MNILIQKLALLSCTLQYKAAGITGDVAAQQTSLEQMVTLHIKLQLAREQAHNKALFHSI